MYKRQIHSGSVLLTPYPEATIGSDAVRWLESEASAGMTLLTHADDGVIWGKATATGLVFPASGLWQQVSLRNETLQAARLFDKTQEVFLWRVAEGKWQARRLYDGEGETCQYFDEPQVLWGTQVEASQGGFSLVSDGIQGLRHAVPLALTVANWERVNRLRLGVRHYLAAGDDGWLRIRMSRLTDVWQEDSK